MDDAKLKEELREIIMEIAEIDDLPDDAQFTDLGIDSMMAIEIVADVERNYKLSIPEEELGDLTTLTAVFQKVKTKLAEQG